MQPHQIWRLLTQFLVDEKEGNLRGGSLFAKVISVEIHTEFWHRTANRHLKKRINYTIGIMWSDPVVRALGKCIQTIVGDIHYSLSR